MSLLIRQPDRGRVRPWLAEIQCEVCSVVSGYRVQDIPETTTIDHDAMQVFACNRFQRDGWQINPPLCPEHAVVA